MEKIKVCLIYPPQPGLKEATAYAPLGLLYLASSLKQHNDINVKVVSLALNPDMEIPEAQYYGIPVLSANVSEVRQVCKRIRIKYPDADIVIGGPHCTAEPEKSLLDFECDFVIDGEGEYVFPEMILKKPHNGHPYSGVIKAQRIYELDKLPFPDRDAFPFEHVFNRTGIHLPGEDIATTIVTSRGCPYHCAFCCKIRTTDGVRYRSPLNIFAEVEHIKCKYNCKRFRIVDDAFTVDRPRIEEICDLFEGRGYSFFCILRADTIQDSYIINRMKAMGVQEVSMGVESADPYILKLMNKRETIEEIETAVRLCQEAGIRVKVFLIEGLPGETPESTRMTMEFMKKCKPDGYTLSRFTPLPGSMIYNHPENFGIKLDDNADKWFYPDENKSEFRLYLEGRQWK